MSERLYAREWLVRVAGIEFTGLDITARIEKSLAPGPNSCSLSIFNLSQSNRQMLEALNIYDAKRSKGGKQKSARTPKTGNIRVEIEAGYKDTGRSLLFRGDLRRAITRLEGPDAVTEVEGEDGGTSVIASRINESFPPGTPIVKVVRACASAMGVGLGNIDDVALKLSGVYSHGTALAGPAGDELAALTRRKGVHYSIQNGVLAWRLTNPNIAIGYLLTPSTGLVGSPERDATGRVIVTALLLPNLSVGGYVRLESRDYEGSYQVYAIRHELESAGKQWYHRCELRPT